MRILLYAFFINLLFAHSSLAQNFRATTFDNRSICEENFGVWREFGNGCVDRCEVKFNKFRICTMALTYGCDCGVDRCWQGDKCVTIEEYKKTYEIKAAEEQDNLEQLKKKRRLEFEENRRRIVEKFKNSSSIQNHILQAKAANKSMNESESSSKKEGNSDPNPLADLMKQGAQKIQEVKDSKTKQKFSIPEFFLRKQEAEKQKNQADQNQQNDTNPVNNTQNPTTTLPQQKNELDQLPLIPLPN